MMPVIGSRFLLRGALSLEWRRYLTQMLLSLGSGGRPDLIDETHQLSTFQKIPAAF